MEEEFEIFYLQTVNLARWNKIDAEQALLKWLIRNLKRNVSGRWKNSRKTVKWLFI